MKARNCSMLAPVALAGYKVRQLVAFGQLSCPLCKRTKGTFQPNWQAEICISASFDAAQADSPADLRRQAILAKAAIALSIYSS
ncbi:hypothetical protein, partial [Rhizobium johnstonii]|uniref:hypothetical protein n=1 Tax=Rhizobium johnstonii TaxID=3019933 RepID=UPI003F968EB3